MNKRPMSGSGKPAPNGNLWVFEALDRVDPSRLYGPTKVMPADFRGQLSQTWFGGGGYTR